MATKTNLQIDEGEANMLQGIALMAALPNVDQRALALAKTNLQQGVMWLREAVKNVDVDLLDD